MKLKAIVFLRNNIVTFFDKLGKPFFECQLEGKFHDKSFGRWQRVGEDGDAQYWETKDPFQDRLMESENYRNRNVAAKEFRNCNDWPL
jgi:hypothetical protein